MDENASVAAGRDLASREDVCIAAELAKIADATSKENNERMHGEETTDQLLDTSQNEITTHYVAKFVLEYNVEDVVIGTHVGGYYDRRPHVSESQGNTASRASKKSHFPADAQCPDQFRQLQEGRRILYRMKCSAESKEPYCLLAHSTELQRRERQSYHRKSAEQLEEV